MLVHEHTDEETLRVGKENSIVEREKEREREREREREMLHVCGLKGRKISVEKRVLFLEGNTLK